MSETQQVHARAAASSLVKYTIKGEQHRNTKHSIRWHGRGERGEGGRARAREKK